jgi:hypothetical protein
MSTVSSAIREDKPFKSGISAFKVRYAQQWNTVMNGGAHCIPQFYFQTLFQSLTWRCDVRSRPRIRATAIQDERFLLRQSFVRSTLLPVLRAVIIASGNPSAYVLSNSSKKFRKKGLGSSLPNSSDTRLFIS